MGRAAPLQQHHLSPIYLLQIRMTVRAADQRRPLPLASRYFNGERDCGRRGRWERRVGSRESGAGARSEVRDDGRFIKCLHREEIKCKYSGGNQNYKSIFEQRELLTFFPHIISSSRSSSSLLLDPQFNSWQDNLYFFLSFSFNSVRGKKQILNQLRNLCKRISMLTFDRLSCRQTS